MKNAWAHIRSLEPTASVLEFHLGGKPSRGLLINDSAFGKRFEIVNMDGYIERLARKSKSLAKRARLLTT